MVRQKCSGIRRSYLDKKSNTRSILNFFLKKETAGNYHTKFQLSLREKQILSMLSRGKATRRSQKSLA